MFAAWRFRVARVRGGRAGAPAESETGVHAMAWEQELQVAAEAARAAGDLLRTLREREIDVLSAVGRDIKTQADQDAEALILGRLAATGHPVLAEESGEHGVIEQGPMWVVDPLDGTLNYSRGVPLCAVSIGLVVDLRPTLGVIYDFNRDELFSGVVGAGGTATYAGVERPLRVSGRREAAQAMLTTGLPVRRDYSAESLTEFLGCMQRFKKVRMPGSAAIALGWVACGRFDAYCEDEIMLWDVAAGLALIEAAGGWVEMKPSQKHKWARHIRAGAHADLWG